MRIYTDITACNNCGGTGTITHDYGYHQSGPNSFGESSTILCSTCHGNRIRGYIDIPKNALVMNFEEFQKGVMIDTYRDSRAFDPRNWALKFTHKPTKLVVKRKLFGMEKDFSVLKASAMDDLFDMVQKESQSQEK